MASYSPNNFESTDDGNDHLDGRHNASAASSSESYVRHARSLRSLVTMDCRSASYNDLFYGKPAASAFFDYFRDYFDPSTMTNNHQSAAGVVAVGEEETETEAEILLVRSELDTMVAQTVQRIEAQSPSHGEMLKFLLSQIDRRRNNERRRGGGGTRLDANLLTGKNRRGNGGGGDGFGPSSTWSVSSNASSTSAAHGSEAQQSDDVYSDDDDELQLRLSGGDDDGGIDFEENEDRKALAELRNRYPKKNKKSSNSSGKMMGSSSHYDGGHSNKDPLTASEKALYVILKTSPFASASGDKGKEQQSSPPVASNSAATMIVEPKCPSNATALGLIESFNLMLGASSYSSSSTPVASSSLSAPSALNSKQHQPTISQWTMGIDPVVKAAMNPSATATSLPVFEKTGGGGGASLNGGTDENQRRSIHYQRRMGAILEAQRGNSELFTGLNSSFFSPSSSSAAAAAAAAAGSAQKATGLLLGDNGEHHASPDAAMLTSSVGRGGVYASADSGAIQQTFYIAAAAQQKEGQQQQQQVVNQHRSFASAAPSSAQFVNTAIIDIYGPGSRSSKRGGSKAETDDTCSRGNSGATAVAAKRPRDNGSGRMRGGVNPHSISDTCRPFNTISDPLAGQWAAEYNHQQENGGDGNTASKNSRKAAMKSSSDVELRNYTIFDAIAGRIPKPKHVTALEADDQDEDEGESGGDDDDENDNSNAFKAVGDGKNKKKSAPATTQLTAFSFFQNRFISQQQHQQHKKNNSSSSASAASSTSSSISKEALTILHIALHYVALGLPDPFGVVMLRPIPFRKHGWLGLSDDLVTLSSTPQLMVRGTRVPIRNIIAPIAELCQTAGNMCHRLNAVIEAGQFFFSPSGDLTHNVGNSRKVGAGGVAFSNASAAAPSVIGAIGTAALAGLRYCLRYYAATVRNGGHPPMNESEKGGGSSSSSSSSGEKAGEHSSFPSSYSSSLAFSHKHIHNVTPEIYLDTARAIGTAAEVFSILGDIFAITLDNDWKPLHSIQHCTSAVFLSNLYVYAANNYQQSLVASRVATTLLRFVLAPVTQMMATWVFSGTLADANNEFFIECTTSHTNNSNENIIPTTNNVNPLEALSPSRPHHHSPTSATTNSGSSGGGGGRATDAIIEHFSVNLDPVKRPTAIISEDTAFDLLCAGLARRMLEGCIQVMLSPFAEEVLRGGGGVIQRGGENTLVDGDEQQQHHATYLYGPLSNKIGGSGAGGNANDKNNNDGSSAGRPKTLTEWIRSKMEAFSGDDDNADADDGDDLQSTTATTRRSQRSSTMTTTVMTSRSRKSFTSLAKSSGVSVLNKSNRHTTKTLRSAKFSTVSRGGGNHNNSNSNNGQLSGSQQHALHVAHSNKPSTFNYKEIGNSKKEEDYGDDDESDRKMPEYLTSLKREDNDKKSSLSRNGGKYDDDDDGTRSTKSNMTAAASVFNPKNEDDALFDAILLDYRAALRGENSTVGPHPLIEMSGSNWRNFFIQCEGLLYGEEIIVPDVDEEALNIVVSHHLLVKTTTTSNGGHRMKNHAQKRRNRVTSVDEYGNIVVSYESDDDEKESGDDDIGLDALSEIVHAAGDQGEHDLRQRNADQRYDDDRFNNDNDLKRNNNNGGGKSKNRVRFYDDDELEMDAATTRQQQTEAVTDQALRDAELAELKEFARLQMLLEHERKMKYIHWTNSKSHWQSRRSRFNNKRAIAIASTLEDCKKMCAKLVPDKHRLTPVKQLVIPLEGPEAGLGDVMVQRSLFISGEVAAPAADNERQQHANPFDGDSITMSNENGGGGGIESAGEAMRRLTGAGDETNVDNPYPEHIFEKEVVTIGTGKPKKGGDGGAIEVIRITVPTIVPLDEETKDADDEDDNFSSNGGARGSEDEDGEETGKAPTTANLSTKKKAAASSTAATAIDPFDPLKSLKLKQRQQKEEEEKKKKRNGGGDFWDQKLVVGDEEGRQRDVAAKKRQQEVDAAKRSKALKKERGQASESVVGAQTVITSNNGNDGGDRDDNDNATALSVAPTTTTARTVDQKATTVVSATASAAVTATTAKTTGNNANNPVDAEEANGEKDFEETYDAQHHIYSINDATFAELVGYRRSFEKDEALAKIKEDFDRREEALARAALPIMVVRGVEEEVKEMKLRLLTGGVAVTTTTSTSETSPNARFVDAQLNLDLNFPDGSHPPPAEKKLRSEKSANIQSEDDEDEDTLIRRRALLESHINKWGKETISPSDAFGHNETVDKVPLEALPSILIPSHIASFGKFVCNYYSQKALQFLLLPAKGPMRQLLEGLHSVLLLQDGLLADEMMTAWSPYHRQIADSNNHHETIPSYASSVSSTGKAAFDVNAAFATYFKSFAKVWSHTDVSYWVPLALSVDGSSSNSKRGGSSGKGISKMPAAANAFDLLPHLVIEAPTAAELIQHQQHLGGVGGVDYYYDEANNFSSSSAKSTSTNNLRPNAARYREFLSLLPPQAIERYGDVFVSLVFWRWVRELMTSLWRLTHDAQKDMAASQRHLSSSSSSYSLRGNLKDVWAFSVLARGVLFAISDFIWFRVQSESTHFLGQLFAEDGKSYARKASLDALTDDIDHCLERIFVASLLAPPFARARRQARTLVRIVEDVHEMLSSKRGLSSSASSSSSSLPDFVRAKQREFIVATDAFIRHLEGASSMETDKTITQMTSMVAALKAAIRQQ